MTENLTLSSAGLALSPSFSFLTTELRACSPCDRLSVPSVFQTATVKQTCESFKDRGPSFMASQKKKGGGRFLPLKAAVPGSDSGAGHPRVRSEDYSFVSLRRTVLCICRE